MNTAGDQSTAIKCEVGNCMYNDGQSNCLARKITVKNCSNIFSEDTMCNTFIEEE